MEEEVVLKRFAILCGSAPEDFRQKKLVSMHDFLVSVAGGSWMESEIIVFPNGVPELMLETVLHNGLEECASDDEKASGTEMTGEVFLYFCARTEKDLDGKLSDSDFSGVTVVRLGADEIRKDVIAYYGELARRLEVGMRVEYACDGELVSERELGWESIG